MSSLGRRWWAANSRILARSSELGKAALAPVCLSWRCYVRGVCSKQAVAEMCPGLRGAAERAEVVEKIARRRVRRVSDCDRAKQPCGRGAASFGPVLPRLVPPEPTR